MDGEEGKRYQGIASSPIFGPHSRRIAYAGGAGYEWFVVVDGNEGKKYYSIVTTKGGRIVFDSSSSLHYLAQKGRSFYLVEEKDTGGK